MLRDTCAGVGVSLVDLPAGLTVEERVRWVMAKVDALGLSPFG